MQKQEEKSDKIKLEHYPSIKLYTELRKKYPNAHIFLPNGREIKNGQDNKK